MSIATEIIYLETELAAVRDKIAKLRHLKSIEEGSSASRFMTQYTSMKDLRKDEKDILTRLETLRGYAS